MRDLGLRWLSGWEKDLERALAGGPVLKEARRVGPGEYLEAPPRGTLWHKRAGRDAFVLHSCSVRPVLEIGDTIGLREGDRLPAAPSGTYLARLPVLNVPSGEEEKAARLYRVTPLEPAVQVFAVPPMLPALLGGVALDPRVPRMPDPGKRWQVYGVDGRTLRPLAAPVPAHAVAA